MSTHPPVNSDIPHGFTEEDGVHAKSWQEEYQTDAETLRNRGYTSDFCGAWLALWQHIGREHGEQIEAESGEPAETLIASARLSAMALMSALVRADKHRAQIRRGKVPAWRLWSYRSGVELPAGDRENPEVLRVRRNFSRYWRGKNGWLPIYQLQVATKFPFFERDRHTFTRNQQRADAASYTDNLTDLLGEIIKRKNSTEYRNMSRVVRFNRAVREVLALFRRECAHECEDRKTCRLRHFFAPAAETDKPDAETASSTSAEKPQRARVINFNAAKAKILAGVEIATARAEAGMLSPEEAEELIKAYAPLVQIAVQLRESSDGKALEPSEDFAHDPAPESGAKTQTGKCDFPAKSDESQNATADKFIRMRTSPESVTQDEFLTAFCPDPSEEINLRAFKPKKAPDGEKRFAPRKLKTSRLSLAGDGDLQTTLAHVNETRGVYFVVNGGGDLDEEITTFRACFAEMDDKPLAEQHAIFDAAPIPPTIRVETLKSVHGYWLLEPGATAAEWREVQARMIAYFKSDQKIKNPSRVMRLPGFNHVRYSDGLLSFKPVTIAAFDAARRFDVSELLAAFPPVFKPQQAKPRTSLDVTNDLDALKRELGARIASHPTAQRNGRGNWDCRAVCHDGKGTTGLFYDPRQNSVTCNADPSCSLFTIARAFGVAVRAAAGAA